jgi:exosortase K
MPFYALGLLLFILLKFVYASAGTAQLIWLLGPTDKLISLFTGSYGHYLVSKGYFHSDLNIMVEKSCSGFNFLLLATVITYFLVLNYTTKRWTKMLLLPVIFFLAWILTIGVNTSRILIAILTLKYQVNPSYTHLIHEMQGIFIYLSFLLAYYKILHYFLTKYYPRNEKFT